MFSHENNPKEAAQKYIDEAGAEIKKRMKEALAAKNLKEFSSKMNELEKYKDEVLHSKKYEEAENIVNPELKITVTKAVISTGSFIADMNRLSSINKQEPKINHPSNEHETKIDYSFLLK